MPRPPARGKRRRWRRWTRPCRQPLARPRPPGARRGSESATGADRAPFLPLPVHVRLPPLNAGASHLRRSARRDASQHATTDRRERPVCAPPRARVPHARDGPRAFDECRSWRALRRASFVGRLAGCGRLPMPRSVGRWVGLPAIQPVGRSVCRSVAAGRGTRSAGSVPPRRVGALLAPAIRPGRHRRMDPASIHRSSVCSQVSSQGPMIHQPFSQLSKIHRHVLRACIVMAAPAGGSAAAALCCDMARSHASPARRACLHGHT